MLLALAASLAVPSPSRATSAASSPSQWHQSRRTAILREHPQIAELASPEPATLPLLAATNAVQIASCISCAHLPDPALIPIAIFWGGTLSLWQFALLHDVKHGTACLPGKTSPNDVIFVGSLPSLFGYYLYLRFGHLSHHKNFGTQPLKSLFDSEKANFEDGDALFVAHRQSMIGDPRSKSVGFFGKDEVGGLGISISRTLYSLLWVDVGGGLVVALTGRNFFFPYKPSAFHETAALYARVSLLVSLAICAAAGPGAILYLFFAEVGWQL
ncbi:MAG: hypothetical protein SGPRY_008745, partial [Prymnesium sp.]